MGLLQVVTVSALVAACSGAPSGPYGPAYGGYPGGYPAAHPGVVAHAPVAKISYDYVNPHPSYDFQYGVKDKYTGDDKSHVESRDGDRVHGQYRLVEPDGSERLVTYTADDYSGFNAVVEKRPARYGAPHAAAVPVHAVAAVPHATGHGYPAPAVVGHSVHHAPVAVSHQSVRKLEGPDVPVAYKQVHAVPVIARHGYGHAPAY